MGTVHYLVQILHKHPAIFLGALSSEHTAYSLKKKYLYKK